MKTISDEKLAYLVEKLLGRISGGEAALTQALQAHLADTGNPHGVHFSQLSGGGGAALVDAVYPVGAIYISARPESPAALFGGSWARLEGRFLLGAGAQNAGAQGGAASHALTVEEMPQHGHLFHLGSHGSELEVAFDRVRTAMHFNCQGQYASGDRDPSISGKTGGNQSFSIMPPYLAVYMWQRTA